MHLKKLLLSFLVSIPALGALHAQDIHFTQYNMSPMTLNSATIGGFEGTVRIGGIYRSQWTSVLSSNQFETPSLWIDAPLIRGFRKQDWIGAGLVIVQDKVGAGVLRHNVNKLGAAYHMAFGKKGTTVLSIGAEYGQEVYRIDGANNFEFGYGLLQGNQAEDSDYTGLTANVGNNGRGQPTSFNDIDGGITLKSKLNSTMDFTLGYAMRHIGQPSFSLLTGGTSGGGGGGGGGGLGNFKQPRRNVFHGTFNVQTSERLTISPSFLFQTMNKQDEIMVQGLAGYLFNPEKDITLNAGIGYRLGDAINLLAGAKIKSLTVGLAYDVNTSGLNNDTRYRGGFEIAANYIVKIYKKANAKPKVLCPRF